MTSKPTGGAAFARPFSFDPINNGREWYQPQSGMTLRDWYAGQALSSIVGPEDDGKTQPNVFAEHAYRIADAMIAERSK